MEQPVARIMQITTRGGTHIQIGVADLSEYKVRKESILKSTKDFVTIIDTCTVSRSDISIIEYFEQPMPEEVQSNGDDQKGGFLQWLRK